MRTMWKGAVSFGLVTIPVNLFAATERKTIKFRHLHSVCNTPIRYERYCPTCEREVEWEEIVRGYEYEKGRFVIIDDEDLESIPSKEKRTIDILGFVKLEEIDPIYFDKTYYLSPADVSIKAYRLLCDAMVDSGRIAVGRVIIRDKEHLCVLRVLEGALTLETMFFPDEVRPVKELPDYTFREVDIHENEKKMALKLIDSLTAPFEVEKYTDKYREALLDIIKAKIEGEEVEVPPPERPEKVVDLMEALRESVRAAEQWRTG